MDPPARARYRPHPAIGSETRQSWIEGNRELIGMLTAPVIFFWFGQRDEDEVPDLAELRRRKEAAGTGADPSALTRFLFGQFPQLVDGASAKAVRPDGRVERSNQRPFHGLLDR